MKLVLHIIVTLSGLLALMVSVAQANDGRIWLNSDTGVQSHLNAVAAYGDGSVIAVGNDGAVIELRGDEWQRLTAAEELWDGVSLSAVAVVDAQDILIGSASRVAAERGVSHWDGQRWSGVANAASVNSRQRVQGLWADRASGIVIAALQSGRVTRLDGGMWSNIISLGKSDTTAVHGSGLDNIWAVGRDGQIHRSIDGGITWQGMEQLVGTPYAGTHWMAVHTISPDQTWLVGSGGEIAFWNGTAFTVEQPTTQTLRAIHAVDAQRVYAAGSASGSERGTLLYFDGSSWQPVKLAPGIAEATWNAMAIDDSGRLWVVGNNGRVLVLTTEGAASSVPITLWLGVLFGLCGRTPKRRSEAVFFYRNRGFSQVELIAVMGILAVLAALTIGVFGKVRNAADAVACQSNLRNIGLAVELYTHDHGGVLPGPVSGGQKLGYSIARYSDRYHLPRLIGFYLELPEATSEVQFAASIACPAWLANLGPAGDELTTPAYLARGGVLMLDGSTANPWGYSSHGTEPQLHNAIAVPETSIALIDIDATVVNSWPGQIPSYPVHQGYQNALFWDYHVERVRFEDL